MQAVDLSHLTIVQKHTETMGDHILVGDRQGDHRIMCLRNESECFGSMIIPFDHMLAMQVAAAMRFWRCHAGEQSGPFPRSYRLTLQQRMRLNSALQHWDARRSGASFRRIAEVMQASKIPSRAWSDSSERALARRIQKLGASLVNGGYRELLNPFQQ